MAGQRKPKKSDFITPDELAAALSALDLRTRLQDVPPQCTPEQAAEIARAMGIDTTPGAIMTEVQVQRTRRRRSRAHASAPLAVAPVRTISVLSNLIAFIVVGIALLAWIIWSVVHAVHHPARTH